MEGGEKTRLVGLLTGWDRKQGGDEGGGGGEVGGEVREVRGGGEVWNVGNVEMEG